MPQDFYFPLWDFNANLGNGTLYNVWQMHMVLFKGSDVSVSRSKRNAERHISIRNCRDSDRHCGAVGRGALAAHLAYAAQHDALIEETDVLDQYSILARSVCQREQMPSYDSLKAQ